ncbi:MAG: sialate O-acetylesterase, partial [Enterococcus hulanensis]
MSKKKKLFSFVFLITGIFISSVTTGYATDIQDSKFETISTYDEYLKKHSSENTQSFSEEFETTLLKRTFLNKVGESTVNKFYQKGNEYSNTLNWLAEDRSALTLFLMGGNPEGNYEKVIENLTTLYSKYQTAIQEKNIYKKLVIALALTYSTDIKSWMKTNELSAIESRFDSYKYLYDNNLLYSNKQFEALPIELLRCVVDCPISDNELLWLANYARQYPTDTKPYNLDPYNYIHYTFDYNYDLPKYYDQNNKDTWDRKYELSKYNIPYGIPGEQKIWMRFEEGSVCGGISETGKILNNLFGIPSIYIGQPGHAAYLIYDENDKQEGIWTIGNSISGFEQSGKDGRMPLNWGTRKEAYMDGKLYFNVSYILLAQTALNDYANYEKATEYNFLADSYDDPTIRENIYTLALGVQGFNWDALSGLISTYEANGTKSQEDYQRLATLVAQKLENYPLPMVDLLKTLNSKTNTTELRKQTLKKVLLSPPQDCLQPEECKKLAISLYDDYADGSIKDCRLNLAIANQLNLEDFPVQSDLEKLISLDMTDRQVRNLSGLENAINLTQLQAHGNQIEKGLSALNSLTKLKELNLDSDGITQEQLDSLAFEKLTNLTDIYLAGNHLFNLERLNLAKNIRWQQNRLHGQSITEEKQKITQGQLTLKIKEIRNVDGSIPTITPANGGSYDNVAGTITWTGLNATTKEVSYSWSGSNNFTGTVTVPIDVAPLKKAISIDSPSRFQVIQRNTQNNLADIMIKGKYTGTPQAIEASWNGGDYQVIDATFENGEYSGILKQQPCGTGNLNVRFVNDKEVFAEKKEVSVGDIFVVAGQNNASGRGTNNQHYDSNLGIAARLFGNDGLWKDLQDPYDSGENQIDSVSKDNSSGSFVPLLATKMMKEEKVPVAFIPAAKGGSSIKAWAPSESADTLYGSMRKRIQEAGGNVRSILWFQGETDLENNMTYSDYKSRLHTIITSICSEFNTSFLVGQIGYESSPNSSTDQIRQAQRDIVLENNYAFYGPVTYDIDLSKGDSLHFKTDEALSELANRWWLSLKQSVYQKGETQFSLKPDSAITYNVLSNELCVPLNKAVDENRTLRQLSVFKVTTQSGEVDSKEYAMDENILRLKLKTPTHVPKNVTFASKNKGVNNTLYSQTDHDPLAPFYNQPIHAILPLKSTDGLEAYTDDNVKDIRQTILANIDGDHANVTIGVTDAAGNSVSEANYNHEGSYTVTYCYTYPSGEQVDTKCLLTVKKIQTAVNVKDLTLYVGDTWRYKDNFISATDKYGTAVPLGKVTVIGSNRVDTKMPGSYKVTYAYGAVKKDATITVKAVQTALEVKDTTCYIG